jgi:hypothetical protein
VLSLHAAPKGAKTRLWIHAGPDAAAYGHDLYANLRRLDATGAATILVEAPPVFPRVGGGQRSPVARGRRLRRRRRRLLTLS